MKYTTFRLNIETLSPLHIGNGESLTSIGEYYKTTDHVCLIDVDQIHDILEKNELLEAYVEAILSKGKNIDTYDFLKGHKIEIPTTRIVRLNIENHNPQTNDILELAIKSNDKLYIPGSSFKGALRSTLFSHLMTTRDAKKIEVQNKIKKENSLGKISSGIQNIEKGILDTAFHYIRPRDSSELDSSSSIVELAQRQHKFQDFKGLNLLRECIAVDTHIALDLVVLADEKLSKQTALFDNTHLEDLFKAINSVTKKQIDFEIAQLEGYTTEVFNNVLKFLQHLKKEIDQADGQYAIMRLGKGKTFYFETILPFLEEEYRDKVLKLKLRLKDDELDVLKHYPMTRYVNDYGKSFGWVKLTLDSIKMSEPLELQCPDYEDNKVDTVIEKETILVCYYLSKGKVGLKVNNQSYESPCHQEDKAASYTQFQKIKGIVWQKNNEDKVTQIKILK